MGKNRIILIILTGFLFLLTQFLSAQISEETFNAKFKNNKININFKSTDIDDVISIFAEKMRVNIIRNENVKAKITASLREINVIDALEIICHTHGINFLIEPGVMSEPVIRIYMQKDYFEALMYRGTAEVIKLKYSKASDIYKKLQESGAVKGKEGSTYGAGILYADEKNNSIIVVDKNTSVNRDKLKEVISAFDQPIPQVLIEAKIISISLSGDSSYGIDWNVIWKKANLIIPFNSENTPASIGHVQGNPAVQGWTLKDGSGSVSGLLTALSKQGEVKILSNPRLVVVNNEPAKIIVGKDEPYSVISYVPSSGSTIPVQDTRFISTGIGIDIVPQINENNIILKIKPNVSSAAERKDLTSPPTISKSEAETIVSIQNKTTLIIGGLIQVQESKTIKRVPILGYIPLLGYLFSSHSYTTSNSELVILLIPTIIKSDYSIGNELDKYKKIEEKMNKK